MLFTCSTGTGEKFNFSYKLKIDVNLVGKPDFCRATAHACRKNTL